MQNADTIFGFVCHFWRKFIWVREWYAPLAAHFCCGIAAVAAAKVIANIASIHLYSTQIYN